MGSTGFDETRPDLWYRARFAGLAVALALAVGTLRERVLDRRRR